MPLRDISTPEVNKSRSHMTYLGRVATRDFSLYVYIYTIPYIYTMYISIFKAYTVYYISYLLINNIIKNLLA